MNFLRIVQAHCSRTGIPVPTAVMSSQDSQIAQIRGLFEEVLEDLTDRWDWEALQREVVFTSVAGEDQGAIATIASDGFKRILNDTIHNRTMRLPLYGPMKAGKWQALKALPITGPFYKYRLRGGHLLTNPPMPAGHTLAFEYLTKNTVLSALGVPKEYPTEDTDTFLFPDPLLIAGLRWKWRSEKGQDFEVEFQRYELLANGACLRQGTAGAIQLDGGSHDMRPGIFISPGSLPLS